MDGPNLYAYVEQNPWTAFDPEGLEQQLERKYHMSMKTGKTYQLYRDSKTKEHRHVVENGVNHHRWARETGSPIKTGPMDVLRPHYFIAAEAVAGYSALMPGLRYPDGPFPANDPVNLRA